MQENNPSGKLPYPRKCHAFNLRQASLAVTALYDKHMERAGVTIQQFSLLWHIKELSPISVTHLAEAMNLDRTTLSRNLALLKRKGFWEEVPSPGRQRQIQLTPDGLNIFMNAQRAWQTAQDELEERLGRENVTQLESLLSPLWR